MQTLSDINNRRKWVCCQVGAREHYAIPRALGNSGHDCQLFTDAWVASGSPLGLVKRSLRERYHPDVKGVKHWTLRRLAFEYLTRVRHSGWWPRIMARNWWFQRHVLNELDLLGRAGSRTKSRPVIFSYSYAAREIFKYARDRGWTTVLGQIDPGEEQAKLARELARTRPALEESRDFPPVSYWQSWREECALADHIVVNSNWSKQCLETGGIDGTRIAVLPLAFEPPPAADGFRRDYPSAFNSSRPLRALFLGQVMLLKGIAEVLDAMSLLVREPVELWVVGHSAVEIPDRLKYLPSIRWFGHVPRSKVHSFYREADVFLFPTWSDGFGLTQLEAQSWKLPVLASKFCGQVIAHGVNGVLLEEVSAKCIARNLLRLCKTPVALHEMSAQCRLGDEFGMTALGRRLANLVQE